MPNPDQCHMDVESNIGAEASSYQWNTGKPKRPLENQDIHADDDDLDMLDFASMIPDFEGPKKDMIGYKDRSTIRLQERIVSRLQKEIFQVECHPGDSQI